MSLTVAKQIELDHLKRDEMKQREAEWIERNNELKEWREERDQLEIIDLDERRQSLDDKLGRSQQLHNNHLNRISTEAKLKNDKYLKKTLTFRKNQQTSQEEQYQAYQAEEKERKK